MTEIKKIEKKQELIPKAINYIMENHESVLII